MEEKTTYDHNDQINGIERNQTKPQNDTQIIQFINIKKINFRIQKIRLNMYFGNFPIGVNFIIGLEDTN